MSAYIITGTHDLDVLEMLRHMAAQTGTADHKIQLWLNSERRHLTPPEVLGSLSEILGFWIQDVIRTDKGIRITGQRGLVSVSWLVRWGRLLSALKFHRSIPEQIRPEQRAYFEFDEWRGVAQTLLDLAPIETTQPASPLHPLDDTPTNPARRAQEEVHP